MRVPLIDGQGNFGSIDGDPPAAMRYTEVAPGQGRRMRCSRTSTRTPSISSPTTTPPSSEPTVLPARFPNLLVNGAGGIAVGMATNIPPHNLGEVDRRHDRADRQSGDRIAGTDGDHPGPGLPDRRHHPRPLRHPQRLSRPAAARSSCAARSRSRQIRGDREAIIITEIPYPGEQGDDDREDRRAGARQAHRGHLRHPRRKRPPRHAASSSS